MEGFIYFPPEIIITIIQIGDIYTANKWIRVSKTLYSLVMQSMLLWDHYLYRDFYNINIEKISVGISTNVDVYKICLQLTKLLSMEIFKKELENKKIKNISDLWNLQQLSLYHNQITEIPVVLGSLVNLQQLYLDGNQITEIPVALGSLANLRILDLGNNKITEIPIAIGGLTNLQILDLSNNHITKITLELQQLGKIIII